MTPAQILAVIRDTALVAGIALVLFFVYRGGEDRLRAADLKALQNQITAQGKTIDQWHQESAHANAQYTKDMAAITAAAARPARPVWVCPPPHSGQPVLPAPTGETGGVHSPGGGAVAGPGPDHARDIGPELSAYKAKYETILAHCRALDAQWPR